MTQIGPGNALAALLRAQISSLRPAPAPGEAASGLARQTRRETRPPQSTHAARPPEDLASAIARRVAAIDPSDPERRRKAFRVFLESVLLAEWGTELLNDPAFHQIVLEVQSQMEGRTDLQSLMDVATDQLLR